MLLQQQGKESPNLTLNIYVFLFICGFSFGLYNQEFLNMNYQDCVQYVFFIINSSTVTANKALRVHL